jgi:hypothetical protein
MKSALSILVLGCGQVAGEKLKGHVIGKRKSLNGRREGTRKTEIRD